MLEFSFIYFYVTRNVHIGMDAWVYVGYGFCVLVLGASPKGVQGASLSTVPGNRGGIVLRQLGPTRVCLSGNPCGETGVRNVFFLFFFY